jgi:peptide/nickel transport system substrate-binding protein
MRQTARRSAFVLLALAAAVAAPDPGAAAADGQITWGVHVTLAPTWFDPAEAPGIITPYMLYYALHDAAVKPMPGVPMAPSLSESWTATSSSCARG